MCGWITIYYEIRHITCGSNQPSQPKFCQFELKRTETGQSEGRLSDFWDSLGKKWANGAMKTAQLWTCCYPSRKGKSDPKGGSVARGAADATTMAGLGGRATVLLLTEDGAIMKMKLTSYFEKEGGGDRGGEGRSKLLQSSPPYLGPPSRCIRTSDTYIFCCLPIYTDELS